MAHHLKNVGIINAIISDEVLEKMDTLITMLGNKHLQPELDLACEIRIALYYDNGLDD